MPTCAFPESLNPRRHARCPQRFCHHSATVPDASPSGISTTCFPMFPHHHQMGKQMGKQGNTDSTCLYANRHEYAPCAYSSSNLKNPLIYGGCSANQPFPAPFPHSSIFLPCDPLGVLDGWSLPVCRKRFWNIGRNEWGNICMVFLLFCL